MYLYSLSGGLEVRVPLAIHLGVSISLAVCNSLPECRVETYLIFVTGATGGACVILFCLV